MIKARARSYSIEIISVDGSEIVSESFGESRERVTVLLNKRKRWMYTVFAYGCQLHPVSATKEISESNLCLRVPYEAHFAISAYSLLCACYFAVLFARY